MLSGWFSPVSLMGAAGSSVGNRDRSTPHHLDDVGAVGAGEAEGVGDDGAGRAAAPAHFAELVGVRVVEQLGSVMHIEMAGQRIAG